LEEDMDLLRDRLYDDVDDDPDGLWAHQASYPNFTEGFFSSAA